MRRRQIGNIHGDEPVGNMLLQRWIWTTCNGATDEQAEVARSVQVPLERGLPDTHQHTPMRPCSKGTPAHTSTHRPYSWSCSTAPTPSAEAAPATGQASYMLNLNPDGYERNSRSNGNGFDLNRNFPTPTGQAATEQVMT